ncbi:MAG: hypothetical protein ACRDQX_06815 [Pseudonocardiaceae bacterium]
MTGPRRDRLLPGDQLGQVVTALYADAEAMDWEHQPPAERTRQYARWIHDERVGGVLTRYMSAEAARGWIKDGPMKEFSRARRAAGRYAEFGQATITGPDDVVRHALGEGWRIAGGRVGVKPFHCEAEHEDQRAFVTWGPAGNFRHLVWAALRWAVEHKWRAIIVVTELAERPTPEDEAAWHKKVGHRCGLEVTHMRERLAPTRPHDEAAR